MDEVSLLTEDGFRMLESRRLRPRLYQLKSSGLVGLPIWVDHVGSVGTVYAVGELAEVDTLSAPMTERMPVIAPRGAP